MSTEGKTAEDVFAECLNRGKSTNTCIDDAHLNAARIEGFDGADSTTKALTIFLWILLILAILYLIYYLTR